MKTSTILVLMVMAEIPRNVWQAFRHPAEESFGRVARRNFAEHFLHDGIRAGMRQNEIDRSRLVQVAARMSFFLRRNLLLRPPCYMRLTKFDVVGHSPTAYKERLFLYLIDLPAHQVNDVFPANLHLAAETLRDREFLQPVEIFMITVKEQEGVRQFLYLSYIFLVEYAFFRPEKAEIS